MFDRLLERALKAGARYADLRHQVTDVHSLEARNGKIERSLSGREEGFGLTVLVKDGWGFYSTNRATLAAFETGLSSAIRMARAASAHAKEKQGVAESPAVADEALWWPKKDPMDFSIEDKEAIVSAMHRAVKSRKEVKSTSGTYADRLTRQSLFSSEGHRVVTQVPRTVAQVHFIAKADGRITSRRVRIGGTMGFEVFDTQDYEAKAREAAKVTVQMLGAPAPPSGRMTVVADPELTGVFTHEAVGHASEGDLVAAGESCLAGKLGQRVGSPLVTIADDSTVPGGFGSFPYDDHGVKSRRRLIVEGGVLKGYLTDRSSAFRLGVAVTASARAESYASRPLVRMTNTSMGAGTHSFDELLEGVKEGVYAVGSRGGQVDTAKGSFQFSAQEAYRIRRGRIVGPLRDVSLTGSTLETLANIDATGREFQWGDPGYCGKGQWVPVGDGGPHIRIQNAIVGGAA